MIVRIAGNIRFLQRPLIILKYIAKAFDDAGYQPLNISQKENNDKICDQIIAEIWESKFLIADFTGNRGGVYFEAGFAHGLDLPVIWLCREGDIKNVHFDVNHYNFIVWKDGEELYRRLKDRIRATII
jgi:nucleoside 2-deoxyribosyltransferase